MSGHAILSASGAHRWINCTPSARLELEFEDQAGKAAEEGTAAHALAEHKLRRTLKQQSKKPVSQYDCDEMDTYTDGYVQFVLETIAEVSQTCKDPLVLIEQKLDFSCYVPEGFGTGDCVIIADGNLHIIDFKYGQGVLVQAEHNPQMMLYALGALRLYDSIYDIEQASMTVYQPRRENISTWTLPVTDLKAWAEDELKSKALLAFEGKGEYTPGHWCRWCRAAVVCRARAEEKLRLAEYEFKKPPLLTDEEIEGILCKLDDLTNWASEIATYAQEEAIKGKQWNGWKIVEGRSNRKYTDEQTVAEVAYAAGYKDIHKKTLLPITEMEKLMGKETFQEILGSLIYKPPGKPTLVPLSDKRPAMTNAQNDFKEIEEKNHG